MKCLGNLDSIIIMQRSIPAQEKGYWHIAKSQILTCTITDKRLKEAGYTFFLGLLQNCNSIN